MEPQEIVQRLIQEAKQSPGRAAVLGGGLMLAVYMWYPLVAGLSKPSSEQAAVNPQTALAPTTSTSTPNQGVDENRWFQQYQKLKQSTLLDAWTGPTTNQVVGAPTEENSHQAGAASYAEEFQKLTVTSTLLGGRSGDLANLNGTIMRVGDTAWLDFSDPSSKPQSTPPSALDNSRWLPLELVAIRNHEVDVRIGSETQTLKVRTHQ